MTPRRAPACHPARLRRAAPSSAPDSSSQRSPPRGAGCEVAVRPRMKLLVQTLQALDGAIEAQLTAATVARPDAHLASQIHIPEHPPESRRERRLIARLHQNAMHPVLDDLGNPADPRGHDRLA